MSTILDALRKLEEEQQSRKADARSRLLQPSIYRSRPARRPQPRWKPSASLLGILAFVVAGFASGVGIMWWRSDARTTTPESVASLSSPSTAEKPRATTTPIPVSQETRSAKLPVEEEKRSAESPTPQVQLAERQPAETMAPSSGFLVRQDNQPLAPSESASPPSVTSAAALPSTISSAREEEDTASTESSVIHHSPFVTSSPAPREVAPKTRTASTPPVSPTSPSPTAAHAEVHRSTPAPPSQASNFGVGRPDQQEGASNSASGATLSLLQWSSDPERRIAFLRVNGGPLTMAHEGDTVGGYKVAEIRQNAVELQLGETHVTLHVR